MKKTGCCWSSSAAGVCGAGLYWGEEKTAGGGRESSSERCRDIVISLSCGCLERNEWVAKPRCMEFGIGLGGGVGGHSASVEVLGVETARGEEGEADTGMPLADIPREMGMGFD